MKIKFTPYSNETKLSIIKKMSRIIKFSTFINVIVAIVVSFGCYLILDQNNSSRQVNQDQKSDNRIDLDTNYSYYLGHSIKTDTLIDTLSFEYHLEEVTKDKKLRSKVYGIDISHWQNYIDWKTVENDSLPHPIEFAIIKSTQGVNNTDRRFLQNWTELKNRSLIKGAYHYFTHEDPKLQAENFIKNTSLSSGDFRPIIDVEVANLKLENDHQKKEDLIARMKVFMDIIESHYGVKPIIYTYSHFLNKYLKDEFSEYPYWIAKYSKTPPNGFNDNSNVYMWQFTSKSEIDGILGHVDMNYCDKQNLVNLLIQ